MPLPKLRLGAKISSHEFTYGYKSRAYVFGIEVDVVAVDGLPQSHLVSEDIPHDQKANYSLRHHRTNPQKRIVDISAFDASRGNAMFVIESVEIEFDHGHVQHIFARRLKDNGQYDPQGEIIEFYHPSGCYLNSIDNITVHGYLKRTFK